MAHTLSVYAIIYCFLSPSLPKHPGKPDYSSIQDTHLLLAENATSIERLYGGNQNGHLSLVFMATQYALVSPFPLVRLTNLGQTPTIWMWVTPFDEKKLSRYHK